ncbi:hypothetical protein FQN52_002829 [Onygenales sp. PD_12]|nr:hypothetical protein FQN52_002829 [Onygenales sp. PD_12]
MENLQAELLPLQTGQAQPASDAQPGTGENGIEVADTDGNGSALAKENGAAEHNNEGGDPPEAAQTEENAPVAKKKKRKTKRSRGKKQGTGFEDYAVDGPITVAEYQENKSLYNITLPAVERLETAIQRYQAKRNLNPERRNVLTKYLAYGGVDVGPKMFEGTDQRGLEDMDAEGILTARAQSSIPKDRTGWDVDFEAVAKGYLSSVLPQFVGLETEQLVNMATGTIRNFLNYILFHDVCPEYRISILAARNICDTAKIELWKAHQANAWAPGDFNMACSTLFGGAWFGFYTGDQEWSKGVGSVGMSDNIARKVSKFAIAGAGSYEQAVRFRDLANKNELKATCIDPNGFEVVAITPPDADVRDFYKEHAPDLQPVGKLRAKRWCNPRTPKEDLPPSKANKEMGLVKTCQSSFEYEFFVEESVLNFCFVGMKVDTEIWELNCGLHYFDKVLAVYCSFYTVLLNESMIGWKEPRDLRGDDVVWEGSGGGENHEGGAGGQSEGEGEGEGDKDADA